MEKNFRNRIWLRFHDNDLSVDNGHWVGEFMKHCTCHCTKKWKLQADDENVNLRSCLGLFLKNSYGKRKDEDVPDNLFSLFVSFFRHFRYSDEIFTADYIENSEVGWEFFNDLTCDEKSELFYLEGYNVGVYEYMGYNLLNSKVVRQYEIKKSSTK
jgi:hypothetical protein